MLSPVADRGGAAVVGFLSRHTSFDGRLPFAVAIGRSVIASAQLLTLLVTPIQAFHPPVAGHADGFACNAVARWSPWCLGSTAVGEQATKVLVLLALLAVASGFSPRLTGVLHWWISFGNAVSFTLPEGGDQVAQNVTLLLIPVCLADPRWFSWRARPDDRWSPPFLRGVAGVFLLGCRIQVVAVYLDSSLAKLGAAEWRNGTEMYYVFRDVRFGIPPDDVRHLVADATSSGVVVAGLTWGAVLAELAIALLLLSGRESRRRWAVHLACGLHVGIFLLIGLFSFAFIMIGAVAIASGGRTKPNEEEVDVATYTLVRCSSGHLFSTIWLPAISFKAIRLGSERLQRCPVCHRFRRVSRAPLDTLSPEEVEQGRSIVDTRIP